MVIVCAYEHTAGNVIYPISNSKLVYWSFLRKQMLALHECVVSEADLIMGMLMLGPCGCLVSSDAPALDWLAAGAYLQGS